MDGFTLVGSAGIRGASLRIHGSATYFYTRRSECAVVCAAAADCLGFTDSHESRPPFCTFKSSRRHVPHAKRDFYVKRDPTPPQPPLARTPSQLTSQPWANRSRVHVVERFLSTSEARTLQSLADNCFRRRRGAEDPTQLPTATATVGTAGCPVGSAAPLLSRVEARISLLTGLPFHQTEEAIMLTRQHPGVSDEVLSASRVHHDQINAAKARRAATVLVYLSDTPSEDGGHTIFPALSPTVPPPGCSAAAAELGRLPPSCANAAGDSEPEAESVSSTSPSRGERDAALELSSDLSSDFSSDARPTDALPLSWVAQTVQLAFERGVRSLGCQACAQQAAVPSSTAEMAAMDRAHRHSEEECTRALSGVAHGLAVQPAAGRAIIFWHTLPDGTPDPHMWHAGCLARSGAGRWALQKFKTPPTTTLPPPGEPDERATPTASGEHETQRMSVDGSGRARRTNQDADRGRQERDGGVDDDDDDIQSTIARAVGIMNKWGGANVRS